MKLVILDRDGVINEDSDDYIKTLEEWIPIPGSVEAIAKLSKAGFTIAVATNQSGIARKYYSSRTLFQMHQRLNRLLAQAGGTVDRIFYCPHGPDDHCECRKPKAGLFKKISHEYGIDLKGVPIVGDSFRDLQPGFALGCAPMLVKTGKGKKTLEKHRDDLNNVPVFENLAEAANYISRNS